MQKILFLFFINTLIIFEGKCQEPLKLWYNKPAKDWEAALPLGNGHIGAMIYGNPWNEHIQLNENTIWAGSPYRNDNPEALNALPEIRKLIFEGKYKEAEKLAIQKIVSSGAQGMPYQTAGNLNLFFSGHEKYTNFSRDLDIEKAVATVTYSVAGVQYKREVFTSFTDKVLIVRITADKPGKINFSASLDRQTLTSTTIGTDILEMVGTTSDHDGIKGGIRFCTRARIVQDGGQIKKTDTSLVVSGANVATLYLSIATNFINYRDISANAQNIVAEYLKNATSKPYGIALKDHISFYQFFFNRVKIDLGTNDAARKTTDTRISQFNYDNDPQLISLYFQFGRYLLICSSQPGGQPANLQGIWNNRLYPAWDSKYTVNINTEMNYWPAEVTNLSEMHTPLIEMIKDLSATGQQTAKTMYGARGWMLHHNTDLWRFSGAIDGPTGIWPNGGAWLSQHLWEKYVYGGDKDYLRSIYPVLKGAALFYLDFLVEEPEHKWLVVSPSQSPENAPYLARKDWVLIASGTTIDNELVFDLFSKTIQAAGVLKKDHNFVDSLQIAIKRLPPMQIGQHGQLQEWMEDWDNPDDHHRHVSHLYGLYPSNQISPFKTPELFEAARKSLIQRGDPSTGWSMNWKINLWARLLDGNHALKLINDQIKLVKPKNISNDNLVEGGGTYPNMFDAHPPFQIDGNFGFTAAIAEMLVQSNDGSIFILPALPAVWKNGHVSGLKVRGGFEIKELQWSNGKLKKLVVKSSLGGTCRIRTLDSIKTEDDTVKLKTANGENKNPFYQTPVINKPIISEKAKLNTGDPVESFLYEFKTKPGISYTFYLLNN
jgi:alpha-L-fucosidase 2